MVHLLKQLHYIGTSLFLMMFAMIFVILIALFSYAMHEENPSYRLYKLTGENLGNNLKGDLRAIPKLLFIQRKSLCIIATIIFLLTWFALYDVDNGAKFISKIFIPR